MSSASSPTAAATAAATQVAPPPVMVRNRLKTRFNFNKGGIDLHLMPVGHPSGEDVDYVAGEALRHPEFLRAIRKNQIEVVDADAETETILAQQVAAHEELERRRKADRAPLDAHGSGANREFVGYPCIGPGKAQGEACGTQVLITADQWESQPPLCDDHKRLRPQFSIVMVENEEKGVAEYRWVRSVQAPKATQDPSTYDPDGPRATEVVTQSGVDTDTDDTVT